MNSGAIRCYGRAGLLGAVRNLWQVMAANDVAFTIFTFNSLLDGKSAVSSYFLVNISTSIWALRFDPLKFSVSNFICLLLLWFLSRSSPDTSEAWKGTKPYLDMICDTFWWHIAQHTQVQVMWKPAKLLWMRWRPGNWNYQETVTTLSWKHMRDVGTLMVQLGSWETCSVEVNTLKWTFSFVQYLVLVLPFVRCRRSIVGHDLIIISVSPRWLGAPF